MREAARRDPDSAARRCRLPPALTPALALAYVRELSADVRAVVVLDAAGGVLAGDGGRGRARLLAARRAAPSSSATDRGVVCAARDDRHALVAACGRFALPGIVRPDLRAVLGGLAAAPPRTAAAAPARRTPRRNPPSGRRGPDFRGAARPRIPPT